MTRPNVGSSCSCPTNISVHPQQGAFEVAVALVDRIFELRPDANHPARMCGHGFQMTAVDVHIDDGLRRGADEPRIAGFCDLAVGQHERAVEVALRPRQPCDLAEMIDAVGVRIAEGQQREMGCVVIFRFCRRVVGGVQRAVAKLSPIRRVTTSSSML
jgi:hypothetical protein